MSIVITPTQGKFLLPHWVIIETSTNHLFSSVFMIYAQTSAECMKELIANNLTETIELRRGFYQNAELNN